MSKKYFCNVIKPSDTKILKFNQYRKSDKAPFIVYADLASLIERIDGCKNNPGKLFTAKVSKYFLSCFSMSIISFKEIQNKHDINRDRDCLKKFCESLRNYAMNIIHFEKQKIGVINKISRKYMKMQLFVVFVTKFDDKHIKNKKYRKVRDHCYYTGEYRCATHSVCNLKYSVPKEIPIAFHNGSNYLLCYNNRTNRKFERRFNCLRQKTEK